MNTLTFASFLSGIFGGTLTFPALKWLFNELKENDVELTRAQKRLGAYLASFALSFGSLLVAVYFGFAALTPDTVFVAFGTAFTTSQAFHMTELDPKPT